MTKDGRFETSRKVYSWLLGLYPREHRLEYGEEMTRLFADQCRSVSARPGGLAILWLRTLVDLLKSAAVEHFTSPYAFTGLLQAAPGKPLSWAGVLLVLVPGLVVFTAQVGQLTGKDWFFKTLDWASYIFLVPVALTWLLTRKFPVWGLVPVGLAFRALVDGVGVRWLYQLSLPVVLLLKGWIQPERNTVTGDGMLGIPLLSLVLLIVVVFLVFRWQKIKIGRAAWIWLGVYTAIVLIQPLIHLVAVLKGLSLFYKHSFLFADLSNPLMSSLVSAHSAILFLGFIILSSMAARRHGRAALLLVLGYLLPVMVFGVYETYTDGLLTPIPPVVINSTVFIYRLTIAIVAPILLARAVTKKGQNAAIILPVAVALLITIGMDIARRLTSISLVNLFKYLWTWNDTYYTLAGPLEILVGILLALALYETVKPVSSKVDQDAEDVGLPLAAAE